jgi:hypothetical protein
MAGFLDTAVLIPFYMVLLGVVFLLAAIGWAVIDWDKNRKYCPERKIFIEARRKGIPVINLVDIGSGNAVFELGTKKNPNDIKFDTKYSGIRIDPILTSVGCEPMRHGGGLDIYSYAYENWLPQTHRNNLAFKAIIEYFHTVATDLEFMTDIEFVSLLSTPETHLAHDVHVYISKYFKNKTVTDEQGNQFTKMVSQYQKQDMRETLEVRDNTAPNGMSIVPNPDYGTWAWYETDITAPTMVDRIQTIKRDVSKLPIAFGWFSGTEAFKNNAYGYSAQDLEMLLIIHDKLQLADMLKKINLMIYVVAALIVMVGAAIAFYIITIAANSKKA